MNSKTLLISVFVLFVFISGTIYFTYNNKENGLYYSIEKSENQVESVSATEVEEELSTIDNPIDTNHEIIIYLYGCIIKEGVYKLPQGARVYEALDLAGGYDLNASKGYVNLARMLVDGESIYFPTITEREALEVEEVKSIDDGLLDINKASVDELVDLPGIGDAKARSIIAYRTMNGDFKQIEDIMNVSGIKESLFMTIRDMIRI